MNIKEKCVKKKKNKAYLSNLFIIESWMHN